MHSPVTDPDVRELVESPDPRSRVLSDERAEDEISLLDILIVAAERKKVILVTTTVFMVVAIIVALVWPTEYTASAALLPPSQNSSLSSALTSQLGNLGAMGALAGSGLGIKSPNEMYAAMIKSRTVEDAMISRYGLMQEYHKQYLSDARKTFEKHSLVDGSGKDGLIRISVEDHDPRRAAELANGYVEQFRKLSEHLAISEAAQRRLFFEQQLVQAKNNLADAEESLKETELKTGLIQIDSQARALIESAAALRAQIAAKEVQIQSLQTYATSQNSQSVQAEQELAALRAQLERLGGSKSGDEAGLIVPKGQVPQAGLEYVRKLRDVKYYETIFDILARQFEIAKLDEAKQGAVIQVVDAAVTPDRRSSPKRTLIVVLATIVGVVSGFFLALVQTGLERMKGNPVQSQKWATLLAKLRFRRVV